MRNYINTGAGKSQREVLPLYMVRIKMNEFLKEGCSYLLELEKPGEPDKRSRNLEKVEMKLVHKYPNFALFEKEGMKRGYTYQDLYTMLILSKNKGGKS